MGVRKERAQDVDGFELVGNFAAGGQLEFAFLELRESKSDLSVALVEPEQSLRLQKKRSVVSDVVDDGQVVFPFSKPEAAAELL